QHPGRERPAVGERNAELLDVEHAGKRTTYMAHRPARVVRVEREELHRERFAIVDLALRGAVTAKAKLRVALERVVDRDGPRAPRRSVVVDLVLEEGEMQVLDVELVVKRLRQVPDPILGRSADADRRGGVRMRARRVPRRIDEDR